MTISLSLEEVDDLTMHALMACDTSKSNVRSVTNSVVASEADGNIVMDWHDFPYIVSTLSVERLMAMQHLPVNKLRREH